MIAANPRPNTGNLIEPVTLSGDDGGLERRQFYRKLKDQMQGPMWKRMQMRCGAPHGDRACGRPFRSWSGLRDHLIVYHGVDRREIPG